MNTNPDARVLVIGAAGRDVIGRLEQESLRPGVSNPARIRTGFGGVARNVAENLARLGQPVSLISVVGRDRRGEELLEHAAAAGIDVSAVVRSPDLPTGFYMGVLDPNGRLQFAVDDMRVLEQLTPEALLERRDLFASSGLLFMDANLPPATLQTACELARECGLPVCADTTTPALAERLRPHLDQLKLVTPNSTEAGILTGMPFDQADDRAARRAARALINAGVEIALITLAEFGVVYATSDTTGHIPAIRTAIVDPVGAGDALTAAVIFGLLNDIPLDDAVRLGVSSASLTLRHPGTVCPDLTLEKLYAQLIV